MTTDLFKPLPHKAQRGSKPRCHLMTHGSLELVSQRLTHLIGPWGQVNAEDRWMPRGFENIEEAQLGRKDIIYDPSIGKELLNWWLAVPRGARIPNWDIASTCTIEGKKGILLIEAKAHDEEINLELAGKRFGKKETDHRKLNRNKIEGCIRQANQSLSASTQMSWSLSIEHHYQMSNRFAWAWKLTELGLPVILVYLGFLKADEMIYRRKPFETGADWQRIVFSHSQPLFPEQIWNRRWIVNGQVFIPLIKSVEMSLDGLSREAKHAK
jgi:hypothetical protein